MMTMTGTAIPGTVTTAGAVMTAGIPGIRDPQTGTATGDQHNADSLDTDKSVGNRFGYKHVTAKMCQGIRKGY